MQLIEKSIEQNMRGYLNERLWADEFMNDIVLSFWLRMRISQTVWAKWMAVYRTLLFGEEDD